MCLGRYAAFNNLYPPLLLFSSPALFLLSSSSSSSSETGRKTKPCSFSLCLSLLLSLSFFLPAGVGRRLSVPSALLFDDSISNDTLIFAWRCLFFFCRDEIRLETPATALIIIKKEKKKGWGSTLFLESHSSLETTCDCVFFFTFFTLKCVGGGNKHTHSGIWAAPPAVTVMALLSWHQRFNPMSDLSVELE